MPVSCIRVLFLVANDNRRDRLFLLYPDRWGLSGNDKSLPEGGKLSKNRDMKSCKTVEKRFAKLLCI